ncbi:MAG: protein kinase, partial [Candidatus Cloacimonetes bacterium]|nr:protein kinase [Candidatus Cloacimonadota bacterium]
MIIDSRYEVIEELGSGVWAIVYKVKDIRTNKIHALKLFQKINATSLYEKFSPENMHHITKIQHPNLIHVSNFGNFGEHIYYLSDYCQGKTLANFKLKASNLELLYDIIVQICYGLNALHSQNIIHKDLKPANVVYTIKDNKPEVKIMDYGFTKIDVEKSQQKI